MNSTAELIIKYQRTLNGITSELEKATQDATNEKAISALEEQVILYSGIIGDLKTILGEAHPEQKANETFIMNVVEGEDWTGFEEQFNNIRLGETAYRCNDPEQPVVEGYLPMFGVMKISS